MSKMLRECCCFCVVNVCSSVFIPVPASAARHTVKGDKAWLCVDKIVLLDGHLIKSQL